MIDGLEPYPAYKDSGVTWLGEVPEHWEMERAKWLFRKMDRAVQDADQVVTCFRDGIVTLRKNRRVRGFTESLKEIGYQGIRRGDLVIHAMDAFAGAIGVADSDGKGTPVYSVCEPAPGTDAHYYAYTVREMARSQWIQALAKGIRERSTDFRFDGFGSQPIPLPPLHEQDAIVRFLDHADRRIRRYICAKQKLIKLLEEQKQAIIHRAVTRGVDANVRFKPSGVEWLGEVPEHWEAKRLKHVSVVQTGITLGKSYGHAALVERPYLRVANVQAGRLDLTKITTVRVPLAEAAKTILQPGDVLMTEGGDIDKLGRGCVWGDVIPNCLHQNHVFAVRVRQDALLPEFLVALMGSPHGRNYFQLTAKQTTNLAATNSTTLGDFPLLLPPVDEQARILAWVCEDSGPLESAIDRARREIALLREYRTRLIADVITGKLDVREAAARLPEEPEELESLEVAEALTDDDEDTVDDLDAVPEETEA
ncbi:MAG: restriction endonuclease subunit S [Gemmatimonadaceae bacterium]